MAQVAQIIISEILAASGFDQILRELAEVNRKTGAFE